MELPNLKPEPIKATEREDLIAAFRFYIDNYVNHVIYDLTKDNDKSFQDYYFDGAKAVDHLLRCETDLKETKSSFHCGDCTKSSGPCDRCMSEHYYNIPSTVNWTWAHGKMTVRKK